LDGVPASPVAGFAYQLPFFGSYPTVRDSELQYACTVAAAAADAEWVTVATPATTSTAATTTAIRGRTPTMRCLPYRYFRP
jgi:hypothetical protein